MQKIAEARKTAALLKEIVKKMTTNNDFFPDRYKGQVALITGGAGGIGFATARRIVLEGGSVALADLDLAKAEKAASELNELVKATGSSARARAFAVDVADFQSARKLTEEVIAAFGKIDVLVNCAGITRDKMFMKMDEDMWNQVIDINLTGTFNVTKNVVPYMKENGYGRIITLSSSGSNGPVGQANYAASKAGLLGFTKTLAKELARYGITINAILPGYTDTEMVRAVPEEAMKRILENVPMRRSARVEEQVAAITFLASAEASYVTGAKLDVNGGLL